MKAIARLCGLIGLLPSALTIRDDLKDKSLEIKDSHASAFVELKDAAKGVSSKSAGESTSQTVRTGKGRHHHHGLSEGHHHHRHKKHHHARRHHDDTDDESTEDERERDAVSSAKDRSLDTSDTDDGRLADEDDLQEEKVPHRSRRKEPEPEEEDVDEDDQEWEDGEEREDPPRRHRTRHSDFEEQRDQRAAPEPLEASPAETETTKKTEQPATTNSSMTGNPVREAVAHSPPPGPLDVLSVIWAWILPCFGWTIVIVLVILVALRIKWPELSNIGVRYVAKRMSLSSRKRKEGREAQDKPEQKEAQGANEEACATPAAASASA